jgi:type I restriction enzyme S subunit
MKIETFFEKFDLFADAPGTVAKMRELILQLASSGCAALCGQIPRDRQRSRKSPPCAFGTPYL